MLLFMLHLFFIAFVCIIFLGADGIPFLNNAEFQVHGFLGSLVKIDGCNIVFCSDDDI